jgi:hypothetical protein
MTSSNANVARGSPAATVRLRDGEWERAFDRLDRRGGGAIHVPSGVHESDPVTIDLASYPNLRDNVAIRGEGLGASVVDFGDGSGDGFSLIDSDGSDLFYLEVTGVKFQGWRDGVLFRLGHDDFRDAYNSCDLHFATNNGNPDATAACRLNHVLNSRHFGVHNAEGGTALELRQVQFGGITGSASSTEGTSLALEGVTLANVVEWLNIEACADGVHVTGDDANINRFGMLYGANVSGTLWRHDADVRNRIETAFVGDDVETIDERIDGQYTVGLSNQPFEDAMPT